ncbi:hypothetical protein [Desulfospira joergensenii]|uniref:hypothetical protein n=1 Tax=Desulfospira joergensenii TaxID=53329 RepID=UPI0003B6E3FB|nr:hypothetical protein [Desulfospira joergensenii]
MRDCNNFEQCFLSSIPYRFRMLTENALKASQESEVMLNLFGNALISAKVSTSLDLPNILIVAIGSYGRLDGASKFSDYDILYLYEGNKDNDVVNIIRKFIKEIVIGNKALLFDHREEIENDTFDFDISPAYPVLSTNELFNEDYEIRALQLLTEGRALCQHEVVDQLKKDLITKYGYTQNINELDFRNLTNSLENLKNAFCTEIIGRLANSGRKLNNKKILKLFALREFFYIATLFSISEIAIGVSANNFTISQSIRKMSSPSTLKISSFGDPNNPIHALIRNQIPEVFDEIIKILEPKIDQIPLPGRMVFKSSHDDPKEISYLRAISLSVVHKFNSLLKRLHDENFLSSIAEFEPDYTTWIGKRQFSHITKSREELIQSSKILAITIVEILTFISEATDTGTFEDAIQTLNKIKDYEIVL